MAKKENVTRLATDGKSKKRGRPPKEEPVAVVEETKDTDTLAKERVEKLLDEVDLTPNKAKSDDLLVLDEGPTPEQLNDVEWLQEQVGALGEENQKLREEAGEAKQNYEKLFKRYEALKGGGAAPAPDAIEGDVLIPDSLIKRSAIELFGEVQNQYLGLNQERRRYTQMQLIHLLNKLANAFPFLEELKRF